MDANQIPVRMEVCVEATGGGICVCVKRATLGIAARLVC